MTEWMNESEPQLEADDDLEELDASFVDDVVDPDFDPGADWYLEDDPDPEAPLDGSPAR